MELAAQPLTPSFDRATCSSSARSSSAGRSAGASPEPAAALPPVEPVVAESLDAPSFAFRSARPTRLRRPPASRLRGIVCRRDRGCRPRRPTGRRPRTARRRGRRGAAARAGRASGRERPPQAPAPPRVRGHRREARRAARSAARQDTRRRDPDAGGATGSPGDRACDLRPGAGRPDDPPGRDASRDSSSSRSFTTRAWSIYPAGRGNVTSRKLDVRVLAIIKYWRRRTDQVEHLLPDRRALAVRGREPRRHLRAHLWSHGRHQLGRRDFDPRPPGPGEHHREGDQADPGAARVGRAAAGHLADDAGRARPSPCPTTTTTSTSGTSAWPGPSRPS